MIPILIRTKDRPHYLHLTLKSLMGSNIINSIIIIVDDCSESDLTKKFLYTNENIDLNKSQLNDLNLASYYLDDLYFNNIIQGLQNRFIIIKPNENKGNEKIFDWIVHTGFMLFKNADRIIILDDDLLFNYNWYNMANFLFEQKKMENLGLISVYNNLLTYNDNIYDDQSKICEKMYMISRNTYDSIKHLNNFKDVLIDKYKIINSSESYIQHIGVNNQTLNFSKKFIKPFSWDVNFK